MNVRYGTTDAIGTRFTDTVMCEGETHGCETT
jgi:hypothetical protein